MSGSSSGNKRAVTISMISAETRSMNATFLDRQSKLFS